MKSMKKFLALLLMVVMALALSVSAFAASITVNQAVNDQSYTAYKIFDVTYSGSGATDPHSYTINNSSPWFSVVKTYATAHPTEIKLDRVGTSAVYAVKDYSNLKAADFAAYLIANKPSTATAAATQTASSGSAALTVSTAGYYLVDSSVGALCALNTADASFTFNEKNSQPTVTKTVKEGTTYGDKNDAKIGDTVEFKSVITIPVGTTHLVYHDKMDDGLALNTSSITVSSASGTYTTKTSGITDGCDFEVSFTNTYLANLKSATTVTITYTATLTADAAVGAEGNENEAKLKYGDNSNIESVPSTTETYTWSFNVYKYYKSGTTKKALAGAGFTLYSNAACTTAIPLKNISGTNYRVAMTGDTGTVNEITTTASGAFAIQGLDAGTYFLKETKVPNGYNDPDSPFTVVIDHDGAVSVDSTAVPDGKIEVENNSGVELPNTGGTGTMMLIVCGCILFMGTAIILVTKKRMYNEGR